MAKYDIDEAHSKIAELENDVAFLEGRVDSMDKLLKQAEATILRQQGELAEARKKC